MTARFRRRGLLRWVGARGVTRLAVRALSRTVRPRDGDLLVGMFHRVLCTELFGQQLDGLLDGGVPVTGSQVLDSVRSGEPLPRGAVWVTFDDAYGDVIDRALPALEVRGVRPTHFVVTDHVGEPAATYWWDRLEDAFDRTPRREPLRVALDGGEVLELPLGSRAARGASFRVVRGRLKALPDGTLRGVVDRVVEGLDVVPEPACRVMDWGELARLAALGHEICNHTHTHPMLDQVGQDAARAEIARGAELLEARLGTRAPVFAYPSGRYDQRVLDAARAAGVELAVTTDEGLFRPGEGDPLLVPRVPVGPHANEAAVRARVLRARLRGRR